MPRVISGAFVPTAISSASIPVGGAGLSEPVGAWLDAVNWLKNNVKSTDVVVMWWDYGNWLTDLGNVTSLADNTTVNATQIENIGFIFMGNENQSMSMLSNYNPERTKYIAIFTVLGIGEPSSGTSTYVTYPGGYGDEGKFYWMAKISGQAQQRFLRDGYMTSASTWTDETAFGSNNQETNLFEWNTQGKATTIYKLLSYVETQYCTIMTESGVSINPHEEGATPTYFKEAYFSGMNLSPTQYGIVPIVAIYEINWDAYNTAMGITG
jgi:asparagine N-glycosylation enzyme membrane subunit Stt3